MTRGQVLLLTLAVSLLWVLLARYWSGVLVAQRRLVLLGRDTGAGGDPAAAPAQRWRARSDARVRRTAGGRAVGRLLDRAALPVTVIEVLAGTILLGLALLVVVGWLLNRPAGVLALVLSPLIVRGGLRFLVRRRAIRMTDQVPELAGALASGAAAGLSLPAALRRSVDDLPEPMAGEVRRALESLSVGAGTDAALREVAARMPSEDLDLLLTTLSVQARGGGNLVRALHRLTRSLEKRREAQREYRSITAGSTATAYLLVVFGLAMTAMLQRAFPGSLDRTLETRFGLIAVLVSLLLYTAGIVLVRRLAGRQE